MARKSVIEEPKYHGRGDKSTMTYYCKYLLKFWGSSKYLRFLAVTVEENVNSWVYTILVALAATVVNSDS